MHATSPRFHRIARAIMLALFAQAVPVAALAADPAASAELEGDQGSPTQLDTITVTAEHRAAPITEVPIAIDAFDGELLRRRGTTRIADLARYSPGLDVHGPFGENGYPAITLRGMNADNLSELASQSVAVYADNVYLSTAPLLGSQMFDVERIEVLKGPQGTLYGRNSIGGALNIHSAAPTFYPDGYARVEAGSYRRFGFEGAYGGPLNEALAYRVATKLVRQFGGPFTDAQSGHDVGKVKFGYLRGQMLYSPDESLSILVNLHGGVDRSDTWPFHQVAAWIPGTNTMCPAFVEGKIDAANTQCVDFTGYRSNSRDHYRANLSLYGHNDNKNYGGSVKIDADLGSARLTSVTGYEWMRTSAGYDEDAGPRPVIDTIRASQIWQVSEELRLASNSDGPLDWITGVYASHDRLSGSPIFISDQTDWFGGSTADTSRLKTTTWGVFGQTDYALSERLKLTAGARYSDIRRDYRYLEQWITSAGTADVFAGESSLHQRNWSGKLGLSYKAAADTLVYANISRGFNAGTYSAYFITSPQSLQPADAETVTAYEVGFKSTLLDRRLQLNGAVYYNDWDDIQISAVENRAGIEASYLINGEGADIYGAELEAVFKPTRAWNLILGVAYLHSELRELNILNLTGDLVNAEGRPLPNSPKWQANGAISHDKDVGRYRLTTALDSKWEDTIYRDLLGTQILRSKPHAVTNFSLTLAEDARGWEVQAYVRNLMDRRYVTEAYQVVSAGMAGLTWSMPRTFGVSFTKRL